MHHAKEGKSCARKKRSMDEQQSKAAKAKEGTSALQSSAKPAAEDDKVWCCWHLLLSDCLLLSSNCVLFCCSSSSASSSSSLLFVQVVKEEAPTQDGKQYECAFQQADSVRACVGQQHSCCDDVKSDGSYPRARLLLIPCLHAQIWTTPPTFSAFFLTFEREGGRDVFLFSVSVCLYYPCVRVCVCMCVCVCVCVSLVIHDLGRPLHQEASRCLCE